MTAYSGSEQSGQVDDGNEPVKSQSDETASGSGVRSSWFGLVGLAVLAIVGFGGQSVGLLTHQA